VPGNRSDKQCDPVPPPAATEATMSTLSTSGATRAELQKLIGR
jgi:hypothetical protein